MKIKEIFYTIQGEGRNWGMASVFVRFGDCNLRCKFCDTDFLTGLEDLEADEVARRIQAEAGSCRAVVFTGGEPLLQEEAMIAVMKRLGPHWYYAVETNGTIEPSERLRGMVDWICCSPKVVGPALKIKHADEIKVVYTNVYKKHMVQFGTVYADFYWVSPEAMSQNPFASNDEAINALAFAGGRGAYPHYTNVQDVINYVKENPKWRLNLQVHKILGLR